MAVARRTTKRPAARSSKKKPVAAKRKTAVKKKVTQAKKKAVRAILKKEAVFGRVTHYYDRIGVAIIELATPLCIGDVVHFKQGTHEHVQPVTSLQIDHHPITLAQKNDIVGLKVTQKVQPGAMVLPVEG